MTITTSQAQGSVPVTILRLQGDLDASNYLDVIKAARVAYGAGARHMLLDMGAAEEVVDGEGDDLQVEEVDAQPGAVGQVQASLPDVERLVDQPVIV